MCPCLSTVSLPVPSSQNIHALHASLVNSLTSSKVSAQVLPWQRWASCTTQVAFHTPTLYFFSFFKKCLKPLKICFNLLIFNVLLIPLLLQLEYFKRTETFTCFVECCIPTIKPATQQPLNIYWINEWLVIVQPLGELKSPTIPKKHTFNLVH